MDQLLVEKALAEHLAQWGLRRFTSDEAYFQWQRQALSPQDLSTLHDHVEKKRQGTRADEIAFYDLTAHPRILPVLYSQRYDYYMAIAAPVAAGIGDGQTILDFGCGPGILTTFYARRFPRARLLGVDRSSVSIAYARQQAQVFNLNNIRFECVEVEKEPLAGTYDRVLATHALLQAEQDPGLPSRSWTTFVRDHDHARQEAFERRTGLGPRLDRLNGVMVPDGRLIVCEKTRQLARRVPLQRAFAARGLRMAERPQPIRYAMVEEVSDDGPFYVLEKRQGNDVGWDEQPEPDEGRPFDPQHLPPASTDADTPLYENHWPSAQMVWERLKDRMVLKQETAQEPDGRQLHVERGTAEGLHYLYCANTFDQRQLVMVEPARAALLHTYYQEIIQGSA